MKHLVQILLVLALTLPLTVLRLTAVQSAPVFTVYDGTESAWNSAVVNWVTEDFEDTTLNPGLSVTATWANAGITGGVWYDRLVNAGEYDPQTGQTGPTTTTWTFAAPISAFGGTWDPGTPGGPGAGINIYADGGWLFVGTIPRDYVDTFWGFVSDVPFTQVRLQSANDPLGWCETYELDNLKYTPALGIEITTPSEGDSYWIGAEPVPIMPSINCQAKVVGITPDPTASTVFTWDYEIHYNPSEHSVYGPNRDISYKWPSSTTTGGSVQLAFRNVIRGGTLTIKVRATVNGQTYTGTRTVKILARNPSVNAIKNQLGVNYTLWRIASFESNYTQFLTDGYPNWSHDALGGVGIMQLTPPSSDAQIWDWTKNVKGGVDKFNYCFQVANRWDTTVQNSAGFQSLVSAYNQLRAQQGLKALTISVPKLTTGDFNTNLQQRELDTIRCYNGAAGYDLGLPLHEFKIARNASGLLIVNGINEHSLTGHAVWVRVPVAERPSSGDPNYVEDVLSQPI